MTAVPKFDQPRMRSNPCAQDFLQDESHTNKVDMMSDDKHDHKCICGDHDKHIEHKCVCDNVNPDHKCISDDDKYDDSNPDDKRIYDDDKYDDSMRSTPQSPLSVVCKILFIFLFLAGVTALTVWLVYRPYKPHFTVVGAAVYGLNATSPPFICTSMQFTIVTRNPNKRVNIIYDKLSAYVSYRNQQITPPVYLPPLHHKRKSTLTMSPVLGGEAVPVSLEVVDGLVMDETNGVVELRVVLLGRLRWKAGAIKTVRYGVYVKCDIWVGLKKGCEGQVPLLGSPPCKVDI